MNKQTIVCGVYSLTDTRSGRKYIGSSLNIHRRWKSYNHSTKLPISIRRNNIELSDIEFDILAVHEEISEYDLREQELQWILKLNTAHPAGFNINNPHNFRERLQGVTDQFERMIRPKKQLTPDYNVPMAIKRIENKKTYRRLRDRNTNWNALAIYLD